MGTNNIYLDSMNDRDQIVRLDIKTDPDAIIERAQWCGIGPGAKVLEIGSVSGKTSSVLHDIVQPGGKIVGIDHSEKRIRYAIEKFGDSGIDFKIRNILEPLEELGQFDFIWVQFFLEFFKKEAPEIIYKLSKNLNPDGTLCLLDLDNNCLNQYELPDKMEVIVREIMLQLENNYNFDPFVGKKLYTYMYEAGYRDIECHLTAHHLIYDKIKEEDAFNWIKKIDLGLQLDINLFNNYPGGHDGFLADYKEFIYNPRRFIYSPLIICKGKKP